MIDGAAKAGQVRPRRRPRILLLDLHRWLGLHIALYFLLMFSTGAVLVFRQELLLASQPERWLAAEVRTPLPLDQIYAAIARAEPDTFILSLARADKPKVADQVKVQDAPGEQRVLAVDPETGNVLGETGSGLVLQVIRDLHANLLVPRKALYLLVTSMSFILTYSIISGLISYRRFWRGYLRLPSREATARQAWGGWHRLFALWLLPFLLILALTTNYFFFRELGLDGAPPSAYQTEPRDRARPSGFGQAEIAAAMAAAALEYPDFQLHDISLPVRKRQAIVLKGKPGQGAVFGNRLIFVDPATLTVLGSTTPRDGSGLRRYTQIANILHFGIWGGVASQVLWVGFAVLSAGLVFAGIRIYLARTVAAGPGGIGWRRFWRALGLFRWAYLLATLAAVAAGIWRFAL